MKEVFKVVNNVLRIVFVGVVGIMAIVKAFDIKPKEKAVVVEDENEFVTSEFDDIW